MTTAAVVAAGCSTGDEYDGVRPPRRASPGAEAALSVHAAVVHTAGYRFSYEGEDGTVAFDGEPAAAFSGEGVANQDWDDEQGPLGPAHWRVVSRDLVAAREAIRHGGTLHERWAEGPAGLEAAAWEASRAEEPRSLVDEDVLEEMSGALSVVEDEDGPLDAESVDRLAVGLAVGVFFGDAGAKVDWADLDPELAGFSADPTVLLDVLEPNQVEEWRIVAEAGSVTTLGAVVRAPEEVVDAFGYPVPDGEVEVDVGLDYLPTALRFEVAGTDVSYAVEARFTDWGPDVEVSPPAGVDGPTPSPTTSMTDTPGVAPTVSEAPARYLDIVASADPALAGVTDWASPDNAAHTYAMHQVALAEAGLIRGFTNEAVDGGIRSCGESAVATGRMEPTCLTYTDFTFGPDGLLRDFRVNGMQAYGVVEGADSRGPATDGGVTFQILTKYIHPGGTFTLVAQVTNERATAVTVLDSSWEFVTRDGDLIAPRDGGAEEFDVQPGETVTRVIIYPPTYTSSGRLDDVVAVAHDDDRTEISLNAF